MDEKVSRIRKKLLVASYEAGACHIGSALSCVWILADLFYKRRIEPHQFFFGKASGVATYYVILSELKWFSEKMISVYLKKYPLPSVQVPGIKHSFGSVGHALSVAAGAAYANREKQFYVLLSDGDCQEGSTLEAALFIHHHDLRNLTVIVDNNKHIACGRTEDILKMEPVWNYLRECIPNLEIVDTIKGEGVDFMQDKYEWHYKNLTKEQLDEALSQV